MRFFHLIICILTGPLGIHRFFKGLKYSGFIFLLLTAFIVIGAIADKSDSIPKIYFSIAAVCLILFWMSDFLSMLFKGVYIFEVTKKIETKTIEQVAKSEKKLKKIKMNDVKDQENNKNIYRIVAARSEEPELNMVYTEVGKNDYEVYGAFSGICGGSGLFYQNTDNEMFVSDDIYEFSTSLSDEDLENIFQKLEKLRAEFENYDDEGNLVGLSEKGLLFIKQQQEDENGLVEVYSEGASEDFIYDVQDEWNLSYYKD